MNNGLYDGVDNGLHNGVLEGSLNGLSNGLFNDVKSQAYTTKSIFFNGTTTYTSQDTLLNTIKNNLGGSVTIWVYPISYPGLTTIFSFSNSVGTINTFAIQHSRVLLNSGGSTQWIINYPKALPLNTWSHLVITHDGITPIVYLNGIKLVGQVFANSNNKTKWLASIVTPNNCITGAHAYSSVILEYFNGFINSVAYYNRMLQAEEVWQLYNTGNWIDIRKFNSYLNCKAWYRYGDNTLTKSGANFITTNYTTASTNSTTANIVSTDIVNFIP